MLLKKQHINSIERTDYLFLYYIKCYEDEYLHERKVYLSALAEQIGLSVPEISKAVEGLRDKGYVQWQTDYEKGRTYVELTSKAIELMEEEKKRMHECYQKIRLEIASDELEQMQKTMKKSQKFLDNVLRI